MAGQKGTKRMYKMVQYADETVHKRVKCGIDALDWGISVSPAGLFQPFTEVKTVLPGSLLSQFVARIGMPDHAHSGIIAQNAAQPGRSLRGSICNDDHSGV